MGYWIGYGKYVFSTEEKQSFKEMKEQQWHSTFITVWRLKNQRFWTDKMIKTFLGEPQRQGKYKVFKVEKVRVIEEEKDFINIMVKRIEKLKSKDEFFIEPSKL
jgi:hypothetical protein